MCQPRFSFQSENCESGNPIVRSLAACLIVLIFVPALIAQPWSSGGPLSELQQGFDVTFFDISVEVLPEDRRIRSDVTVHVYPLQENVQDIELDLINHYEVSSVTRNGDELNFSHSDDKLVIQMGEMMGDDEVIPVRIRYSGEPPVAQRPPWEGGFTWDEDRNGNHWIGLSKQLEGAKLWLPVKDHPTSRADSVRIAVTVPQPYVVASNGLLKEITEETHSRHTYHWFTRYPIHNYNINFTVGMFQEVSAPYRTINGVDMPVVFYVLEDDNIFADELLEMTVRKLEQMRHYFGEYAFTEEKFGLVQTPYLGMEHQTINAYGNKFRYTEIDGRKYDWLLLHELIHEWWGNAITVKDWSDFWIHEGITTFTDALFLWDYFSPEVYYDKMQEYVGRISNLQPLIPGSDVTSDDIYNHDVYYKGAWFMHTLMHVMRRPVFLEAIRNFAINNRYGYTSTEAFLEFFQRYTATNLEPIFDLYLFRTELPDIEVVIDGSGIYSVRITNMEMELPMEILTSEGIQLVMVSGATQLIESETEPVIDPNGWYLTAEMFEPEMDYDGE